MGEGIIAFGNGELSTNEIAALKVALENAGESVLGRALQIPGVEHVDEAESQGEEI